MVSLIRTTRIAPAIIRAIVHSPSICQRSRQANQVIGWLCNNLRRSLARPFAPPYLKAKDQPRPAPSVLFLSCQVCGTRPQASANKLQLMSWVMSNPAIYGERPQTLAVNNKYPGLERLNRGWKPRFLVAAMIASAAGPPSASNSSRSKVADIAFWESRLNAEISIPAANEQNNAFTRAS